MRAGLPLSIVGHVVLITGGLIALPHMARSIDDTPVPTVSIDLVTISDETNIRAAVAEEEPEPEPVEEVEAAIEEDQPEEPPAEEVEETQAEPEPVAEEPEPEPEVIDAPEEETVPEEPEPEPEPEPKPEPKKEESFSLDRISSLIDKAKKDEKPKDEREDSGDAPPERAKEERQAAGLGTELTISEYDALRRRMQDCWRTPVDAPDPDKLAVSVRIQLNRDGTLAAAPRLMDRTRIQLSGDPYLRLAGERAVRAVQQCAPYSFLPADKYSVWREITMNFDATN